MVLPSGAVLIVLFEPLPPVRSVAFERPEPALVGHLAAAGDPVAEIGIGQAAAGGLADQP
jgi:hypothetical protein